MAILPSGYTQLEYIESTGTQYINLGEKPNSNWYSKVIFSNSASSGAAIFGAEDSWKNNGYAVYSHLAEFGTSTVSLTITSNAREVIIDNGQVYQDGSYLGNLFTSSFQTNYNIYIFARNRRGSIGEISSTKLYSLYFSNGSLNINLIPCINSVGEIGLYDTISGNFLSNNGTGNFIAGPEIPQSSNIHVKINDVWQPVTGIYTKTNNTW